MKKLTTLKSDCGSKVSVIGVQKEVLIVEFFENGKHVGEIEYPDKSMYYVKDAAENWVTGIMTKDTIRKYSIAA